MDWYIAADPEFQKKERAKGRELRRSQWWKNQLAKGVCYYCEKRFPSDLLTMDHKVPIARGGRSTKSNVVVCCKNCNSEKQAQTVVEKLLSEGDDGNSDSEQS